MGGGRWDNSTYDSKNASLRSAGYRTPMKHTEDISTGRKAAGVHEMLDPKAVNKQGEHAEQNIRESLDSTEHPETVAVAVLFDQTSSMAGVPAKVQAKLPALHGLVVRKGYLDHPQFLFGAIGDAWNRERAPLQVGQFESDNRMDETLANIYLEKMGGGGNHESYELGAYFLARHTYIDCFEKRQKKGYVFFIGDERTYATVDREQVKAIIGDDLPESISTVEIFAELQEKFEVFFLFATEGSYGDGEAGHSFAPKGVLPEDAGEGSGTPGAVGWRKLVGERALKLEDADGVCEVIALAIGLNEGAVSYEEGMEDLKDVSGDTSAVMAAGKALATVGGGSAAVATTEGDLPGMEEGDSGSERV